MRLRVSRWEACDETDGTLLGWVEHCEEGWLAGVYGVGYITSLTSLSNATRALKVELDTRAQWEAAS